MMRMLGLLLISFGLAACSITRPITLITNQEYTITSVNEKKLAKIPSLNTLLVSKPQASPGYLTTDIVYSKQPFHLESYSINQWVAPPADMLNRVLVVSLQNSGYFAAVVMPPYTGLTTYRLDTSLLRLEQVVSGNQSQLYLSLSMVLINTEKQIILAERNFSTVVPVYPETPYGVVVATNKATKIIMQQLSEFVVKVLHHSKSRT